MSTSQNFENADEYELLPVEIGDVTVLTEGLGGGHSEDKRRAYNC
ncbi:albusnodin family lasso peptide [Streptomyces cyaneofuscatus]